MGDEEKPNYQKRYLKHNLLQVLKGAMSTFGDPMVYIYGVNIVYCDTLEQKAAKTPKTR